MFLGRPRLRFPSGVQCRAVLSAGDMSDLSPSPSQDDGHGLHALLVTAGEKLLVGDGLKPENTRDPSEVLCMEGGELVHVTLRHPPLFRAAQYSRVESTQLWYSLRLVLMLYWDDLQTLFIILKAFLALLRRFLMSLPVPPSCLTMLPT